MDTNLKTELSKMMKQIRIVLLICSVLVFVSESIYAQPVYSGYLDPAFDYKTVVGQVRATAIQADGKILIGGTITSYDGVTIGRLTRLNADGTHDTGFQSNLGTGFNNDVWSIVVQPDGDILVGGAFTSLNGSTAKYVVRLNNDGTRDNAFSCLIDNGPNVRTLALDGNGKILVGGSFSGYNGNTTFSPNNYIQNLIRLNNDGSLDNTFVTPGTSFNADVVEVIVQPDGKLLIIGLFNNYNQVSSNKLARLNTDASLDNSLVVGTGFNGSPSDIVLLSNGDMLISGTSTFYNGQAVTRLVRLSSTGTLDNTFSPTFNTFLNALAVQPDGKILVGGNFTTINGVTNSQSTSYIGRLFTDGTLDTDFKQIVNSITVTYCLNLQSDNKIIVGQDGRIRRLLNIILSVPAAPTNLVATPGDGQISINFTAGSDGNSPVTNYEYTLDGGTTWTPFSPPVTGTTVTVTSLTNGTEYTIQLRAVNAIGNGVTSTSVTATPALPPAAPTGLVATPGDGQIEISFTPGADGGSPITNYQYTLDGGATWVSFSPPVTGTTVTITTLTNGTMYNVALRAVNATGGGVSSTTVGATPVGVPAAPTGLVATPGDGQIEISFTPGADGGSPITNYEYSLDGGTTWTAFIPTITASPVIILGLTNGTAYSVKLRAVNSVGSGAESTPVTGTPESIDGPNCGVFTNKSTADGLGSKYVTGVVVVSSTVYASTAGGLSISTDGGLTYTNRTDVNSGLGSINLNGVYVVGSTVYAATNNAGLSISTDGGQSFTSRTTANGLGSNVIRGVHVNGSNVYVATNGGLSISTDGGATFTNRTTANGLGHNSQWSVFVSGNKVYAGTEGGLSISTDGGATFTNKTTTNGLGSNFIRAIHVIGLKVYVATTGGISISTDGGTTFTNRTTADGLGQNFTYEVNVAGTIVYAGTRGGLSISSDGGSTFTNYTMADGLGDDRVLAVFPTATKIYAATYQNTGVGGVSFCTPPTVPDAPTNLVATPGNGQIQISYTPGANGGSPITNYEYTLDGGMNWIPFSPAVTGTTVTVTNLTNGSSYTVQLRAVNAIGHSVTSTSVTTTVGEVPGAPAISSAAAGVNSAIVYFTPPANNGSAIITNYQYSIDGGTTWVTRLPESTSSPLEIIGLTECTEYSVIIRAVNGVGSGAASAAATVTPRNGQSAGIDWVSQTVTSTSQCMYVTYGNGLYVAVAKNTNLVTSPDGINWTQRTKPSGDWQSVTWGNGLFVAVSHDGKVMSSPDGATWTLRTAAANYVWNSVTYGNGLFVAVSRTGLGNRIMTSPDGINWTSRTSPANYAWKSVTYGNGKFVAVAEYNTFFGTDPNTGGSLLPNFDGVMTSTDGINWTLQTTPMNYSQWYHITYGGGLFVAVGVTGGKNIMTSPDGVTWTLQTTPTAPVATSWSSVSYGAGLFVAVGFGGTYRIMTSPNGTTWTGRTAPAANNWRSVTYADGRFVAVSFDGTAETKAMTSSSLLVPDKPVINSITPGTDNLSVDFTAPADAGGSPITNYEYSVNNGSTWVTLSPVTTTSPVTITGLAAGTSYDVQLRAVNTQGIGCASATVSATTGVSLYPPDAPTNLVPTPGVGQITINFTLPASDGGSPITNYEYTLDGGMTWIPFSPAVTGTTVTVTNLTCGTTYTMQLRAVNAVGAGASSTTVTATIDNTVTVTYTGVTGATATNKSATITISATVTLPVGADVTQSKIRFINRKTGQDISGWLSITAGAQPNTGTASYTPYTLTLGTHEIFKKYTIGFEVGNTGCYTRNSPADNVTVTLAEPGCGCY